MTTPERSLIRPVVLIGLMGAGKTSVGTRLAARLGVPFTDSDHEIEAAAAMTIAEIFAEHGEPYFRDGERRVIRRLLKARPQVLATGGGAFMNDETRALIGRRAVSVWLRAPLDVLVARTQGRSHRPLLNRGNPRDVLSRLIEERHPVYGEADVVVESHLDQSHEDMVSRIVEALTAHARASDRGALALQDAQ